MQAAFVWQLVNTFDPDLFLRWQSFRLFKVNWPDGTELKRTLICEKAPHLLRHSCQRFGGEFCNVLEPIRARHIGHLGMML